MANALHTCLCVGDLQKSRGFYEALGFSFERTVPVVRDGGRERVAGEGEDPNTTIDWFGFGEQQMTLELRSEHDGHQGEPEPHVGLFVADLHATVTCLAEQGFEIETPPYEPRKGVFIAFVRDPDRNLIELIGTP